MILKAALLCHIQQLKDDGSTGSESASNWECCNAAPKGHCVISMRGVCCACRLAADRHRHLQELIFYSLPQNPAMYAELVGMLRPAVPSLGDEVHGSATASFTRLDAIRLGLVVGADRARKMLKSRTSIHILC